MAHISNATNAKGSGEKFLKGFTIWLPFRSKDNDHLNIVLLLKPNEYPCYRLVEFSRVISKEMLRNDAGWIDG